MIPSKNILHTKKNDPPTKLESAKRDVVETVDCLLNNTCTEKNSDTYRDPVLSSEMNKVKKELIGIVESENIKESSMKHDKSFYYKSLLLDNNSVMLSSSIILLEREDNYDEIFRHSKKLNGRNAELFLSLISRYEKINQKYHLRKKELINHFANKDNDTLLSIIKSVDKYGLEKGEFADIFSSSCPISYKHEIDDIIRIKLNSAGESLGLGAALCQ